MMGKKKSQSEKDIDYAATADTFFENESDAEEDDGAHKDSDAESRSDDSASVEHKHDKDGEPGDEEDEDEDSDEDESREGSDEEGESEEHDDERVETSASAKLPSTSSHGEPCIFDLRNLLATNSHQVDSTALYSAKGSKKTQLEKEITIPSESLLVSEQYLLEKATDGCQQLIASLWQLPVERSDAGPLVTLPAYEEMRIPRALVSLLPALFL